MEACGNLGLTERQPAPPALPVKQRRSVYSDDSVVYMDSEGGALLGPVGLRQQNQPHKDVVSEPTHCQAAQCPIHQGYDSSCCDQDEVFSEYVRPPPVPRKKLVRTMSLPGWGCNPPTYPQRPPGKPPVASGIKHPANGQHFDNPLYMLTPRDALSPPWRGEEPRAARGNPHPSSSAAAAAGDAATAASLLSQLSFDTPDEQLLPYLLSDAAGVSRSIAQRHVSFLRSAAARTAEADLLLPQGEEAGASYTPEDFQLCDGHKPRQMGDNVYYKLHCSKFPNKVLGARVYKSDNPSSTAQSIPRPPHVNLQEVLVHFSPCSTQEATRVPAGTHHDAQPACAPPGRPLGGGSEPVNGPLVPPQNNPPTITELLARGHCVSVERDLPQATLEDFFRCRCAKPAPDPASYAKQLCVVLLQVVTGLQQLCGDRAMYTELRPSSVFLVWPSGAPSESRGAESGDVVEDREQGGGENRTAVQDAVRMNWGKLGAPRVVLADPPHRALPTHHAVPSTNAQIAGLIRHGLNPGESLTSVPRSTGDPYTERLLGLAARLQDESSAPLRLSDTKTILQALLWGPRAQLFTFNPSQASTVDAWLAIRRALLVLRMAERGLLQDGPPPAWEERLCLQYLASCDGEGLMSASERIGREIVSPLFLKMNLVRVFS